MNLQEQKEKAWKNAKENEFEIKLVDRFALTPKVEEQMKLLHDIGFDSGAKAERERILAKMIELKENDKVAVEYFLKKLFPESGGE